MWVGVVYLAGALIFSGTFKSEGECWQAVLAKVQQNPGAEGGCRPNRTYRPK